MSTRPAVAALVALVALSSCGSETDAASLFDFADGGFSAGRQVSSDEWSTDCALEPLAAPNDHISEATTLGCALTVASADTGISDVGDRVRSLSLRGTCQIRVDVEGISVKEDLSVADVTKLQVREEGLTVVVLPVLSSSSTTTPCTLTVGDPAE